MLFICFVSDFISLQMTAPRFCAYLCKNKPKYLFPIRYLLHRYAQNREANGLIKSSKNQINSIQIDYLIYSLPPIP